MFIPLPGTFFDLKLLFTALLLLSTIAHVGCAPREVSVATGAWPWVPVGLEVHGLSRFIVEKDEEILSLRVEFLDQDGDPTKYPGMVRIEVDPAGSDKNSERDFEFDLGDPEVNEENWDHVSSMYRFRLSLDWDEPPLASTAIRVRVSATLEGAPDLSGGMTLRRGQ